MSFNKRFFNWEGLVSSASTSSFESFDHGIMKIDAHISDCQSSGEFLKLYSDSNEATRRLLKDLLCEREVFSKDFIKLHSVIRSQNNEEKHEEGINSYVELFFNKWGDFAIKYKNILEI